ncbi:hypothetical protein VNI00_000629 [Paramarasmius palmivorus]|uniref:Histone H2A n=1 Tax=Paramarasmius palmivorus TaxID=297713 RepID=A0AAW0EB76_9AGAR
MAPNTDQIVVLYVIIAMAVVIFGFWNVPGVRLLINPFKLFTIGAHELFHIIAAILSGGRILRVSIDPHLGGATIVEGGRPTVVLASGYLGSTLLGGLFVLAGWDILVAKIMSFVLGVGLIIPLRLVRDKLTIILTVMYEILLIGFWFVDHGSALRWYCLFIGVMNILFVVWDVADDRFFHKTNDSDATQFAILYPSLGPHIWATAWITFALGALVGFALLGIFVFKRTPDEMYAEAGFSQQAGKSKPASQSPPPPPPSSQPRGGKNINIVTKGKAHGKGKEAIPKARTRVRKQERAGLQFPVARVHKNLKRMNFGGFYTAAVLEYLVAELCELAGNASRDAHKRRIIPRHLQLAIKNDDELDKLLSGVTISQGGVVATIHPQLLPRGRAKKPLTMSQEV